MCIHIYIYIYIYVYRLGSRAVTQPGAKSLNSGDRAVRPWFDDRQHFVTVTVTITITIITIIITITITITITDAITITITITVTTYYYYYYCQRTVARGLFFSAAVGPDRFVVVSLKPTTNNIT